MEPQQGRCINNKCPSLSIVFALDPRNVSSLSEEEPDEFTKGSRSNIGLAFWHPKHSLVGRPKGYQIPRHELQTEKIDFSTITLLVDLDISELVL